jgi:hypothetical protein
VQDLIRDQDNLLALRPKQSSDVVVTDLHSRLRVDHEKNDIGLADRKLGLSARLCHEIVHAARFDAARVHDSESAAKPLDWSVEPVARHAGSRLDDCEAATEQTIEQRGFTHVGTPYEGDDRR